MFPTAAVIEHEPGPVDEKTFMFRLDPSKEFHLEQLREPAHIELIESRSTEAAGRPLRFRVRHETGAGTTASEDQADPWTATHRASVLYQFCFAAIYSQGGFGKSGLREVFEAF